MTQSERRIGFLDYQLDNFHANTYLRLIREDLAERGFTVAGCTALKAPEGRAWAETNGVPYYDDPAALNEDVDFFVVLAPSNPECHWDLCRMVFPCGKPTYVDKTFAPDLVTAKRIFDLADRHKVKAQTSSALRYTAVQELARETGRARVRHMTAWGGGRSFEEYAIHPVELVVSCMGAKAERLMRRGTGKQSQLLINYSGGRTAVINVYVKARTPFAASVTTAAETRFVTVDNKTMFRSMASAILDLFESGKVSVDRAESLMVRRILDVAASPRALRGFAPLAF
jgi:predicted dehydrogenase